MDWLFDTYMVPVWLVLWVSLASFIRWFDGKYAPWN